MMSWRAMLETALSVGIGVSTVGGMAIWLLREKVAQWVKKVMHGRLEKVESRLGGLEGRMDKVEESATLMAEAAKNISQTLNEGMQRMTRAFEAVGDEVKEQGKAIARIEGSMERRQGPR